MDRYSLKRIVQSYIFTISGDSFQNFVDRLCLKLHPEDYQPVRAGGPKGDMKNDGYCPKARIFYAAFGTRGTSESFITSKIKNDLSGCLTNHSDVKKWVFLTNDDKFVGAVETFIDGTLRPKYIHSQSTLTSIEAWGAIRIVDEMFRHFEDEETIAEIAEINLTDNSNRQHNTFQNGTLQFSNQANSLTQHFHLGTAYQSRANQDIQDFGIIDELLTHILDLSKKANLSFTPDNYDLVNIQQKLTINFTGMNDRKTIRDYLVNCFEFLPTVEYVFSCLDNFDQKSIRHQVRTDYEYLRGQNLSNVAIFSNLSQRYNTQHNERYNLLSLCLVTYFFDDCTIFEKTEKEASMIQLILLEV